MTGVGWKPSINAATGNEDTVKAIFTCYEIVENEFAIRATDGAITDAQAALLLKQADVNLGTWFGFAFGQQHAFDLIKRLKANASIFSQLASGAHQDARRMGDYHQHVIRDVRQFEFARRIRLDFIHPMR